MKKMLLAFGISVLLLISVILAIWGILTIVRLVYTHRSAPDRITESWQGVNINGIATFKVPTEWNVEEHNGIVFITDKPMADGGYTIYIVGASHRAGLPLHTLFEGIEGGNLLHSRLFRRSLFTFDATLGLHEYTINGVVQEHHMISIDSFRAGQRFSFGMFVWSRDVVTEWYAEQIAKTLIPSREFVDFDDPTLGQLES